MQSIVSQDFFSHGTRHGIPCALVDFTDVNDSDIELSTVVSDAIEYRGKVEYICVRAILAKSQTAISLIRTMSEAGFRVVVETDTTDDISFFVHNKRINFSMKFVPPTTGESNLNHVSLNLLREGDEIVVESKEKAVIDFAVKAIKEKYFTRPDLIFKIPKSNNQLVISKKFACPVRVIN